MTQMDIDKVLISSSDIEQILFFSKMIDKMVEKEHRISYENRRSFPLYSLIGICCCRIKRRPWLKSFNFDPFEYPRIELCGVVVDKPVESQS